MSENLVDNTKKYFGAEKVINNVNLDHTSGMANFSKSHQEWLIFQNHNIINR